jgi:phenylalanine-4-hydroxylase
LHVKHIADKNCKQNFGLKGKRPLGRPGHRDMDNTEMNLKEIDYEDMDRIQWQAFVNRIMNMQHPNKQGEFLDYLDKCSQSTRELYFM